MARRKRNGTGVIDILFDLPWWGAMVVGLIFLGFATGATFPANLIFLFFAGVSGLATLAGLLRAANRLSLWSNTNDIASVRNMSWREFEALISEAYKRRGFCVEETGGGGPDGGIDLVLYGKGEKVLVQCKRWKVFKVSVKIVREMYGLMVAEKAARVIIVSSGTYTRESRDFARGKPIELIDGDALIRMIASIKNSPRTMPISNAPVAPPSPKPEPAAKTLSVDIRTSQTCPRCGSPMIIRTAKRGINAGNKFWGCTRYPECRGIVNVW